MKSLFAAVVIFSLVGCTVHAQEPTAQPPVYLEAKDCVGYYDLANATGISRQKGIAKDEVLATVNDKEKMRDARYRALLTSMHGLVEAVYETSPEMPPEELASIAYDSCMQTYMTGQL